MHVFQFSQLFCVLLRQLVDMSLDIMANLTSLHNDEEPIKVVSKLSRVEVAKFLCHSTEATSLNGI